MGSPIPNPVPNLNTSRGTGIVGGQRIGIATGEKLQLQRPRAKPPGMKTLVYTPECKIYIARGNKQYDLSADLVGGSVLRKENSASSIAFRVINKELRYNDLFKPMDRVIVLMKRIKWVQTFSGHLDEAPFLDLYEGVTTFTATCTLKRLMMNYWDPGLPESQAILQQSQADFGGSPDGQGQLDAGLGSLLRKLLREVGDWSDSNIHIQDFPVSFMLMMGPELQKRQADSVKNVEAFKKLLLGSDTTGGQGSSAGRAFGVTQGSYGGGAVAYQLEIMAAVDERRMGPRNQDVSIGQSLKEAGTKGAQQAQAQSVGSFGASDAEAWENVASLGTAYESQQRESDALVICLMTVMVESNFLMYANPSVPESMNFPHDAIGYDHDSVGLFQQRNNGAWGTTAQRMNARSSAGMFLNALSKFDWRNMEPGQACQRVQGSAFPERYQAMYQQAKALATALRQGQTGAGAAPPPPPPGLSSVSGITALPGAGQLAGAGGAMGGSSSPASIGELRARVGKPNPDSEGAVQWAMTQLGVPYGQGTQRPGVMLDCSGLVMFAYRSIGIETGRTTWDQAKTGKRIQASQIQRGDLIQPHDGHTSIYLGGGMVIQETDFGRVCEIVPAQLAGAYGIFTYCDNGGPDPSSPFAPPELMGPGLPPQTAVSAAGGSGAGTMEGGSGGTTEPIARNLFSWMFDGKFASEISGRLTGEKAYLNDEPLMQMIQAVSRAGLRHFASAPNGDFVAYYPDYFGLDGKQAVLNLEDVEMKNVRIKLNDNALTTHVYVAGDTIHQNGSPIDIEGWIGSQGYVSVEDEWLFKRLAMVAPGAPESLDGKEIMRRYGVRPLKQEYSSVASGQLEFLIACQIFMQKWAEQYATSVELTFMPELFPGMRVNLVGHNLQVYVTEVTHNFDFEQGFSTSAVIMAPSNPNAKKLLDTFGSMTQPVNQEGATNIDSGTSNYYFS